jgi:hypothetical protein
MDIDFSDLERLAQQPIAFSPRSLLATQATTYQAAPLAEVFDLLESAVESYAMVQQTLAPRLQESAQQEIEFFFGLLQERLNMLMQQTPQIQKISLQSTTPECSL